MFARPAPSLNDQRLRGEIRAILSEYTRLAQNDPSIFRLLLPPQEIWRYFVDSVVVESGREDWRDYEKREPGYLRALYAGFHEIFNLRKELDIDFILHLHRVSTQFVDGLNYDKHDIKSHACTGPGLFRHCTGVEFRITENDNATQDGLFEFITNNPRFSHIELNSIRMTDANVLLLRECYRHMRQQYVRITVRRFYEQLRSISFIPDLPDTVIKNFIPVLLEIAMSSDNGELANCLTMQADSTHGLDIRIVSSLNSSGADGVLTAVMNQYIDQYHTSLLKTSDPISKLYSIITLVQSSEQLHPFSDANCRTFCMLLLNHLLLNNGFPLALLKNPNRFDAFSKAELLDDLLQGMKASIRLVEGKQDSSVRTDDIIPNDLTLKHYFEETVAIEKNNRKRQCIRRHR